MTDIEISAESIPTFLHWDLENLIHEITVECNYCNRTGYMFYAGTVGGLNSDKNWIANAAMHITEHHPKGPPT